VSPASCRDDIHVRARSIHARTGLSGTAGTPDPAAQADRRAAVESAIPVRAGRGGSAARAAYPGIDHTDSFAPAPKPDPSLIKAIANAHRFNDKLLHGRASRFADLAKSEKLHRSYFSQVLRLAYLAPDITAAILEGRQPEGLTATVLIEYPNLPLSWHEQRAALGFS
jgi:site-specific DNA recombinase